MMDNEIKTKKFKCFDCDKDIEVSELIFNGFIRNLLNDRYYYFQCESCKHKDGDKRKKEKEE